jgi:hypothetical protein
MFRSIMHRGWPLVLAAGVLCCALAAHAEEAPPTVQPEKTVTFDTPTPAGIPHAQQEQLRAFLAPRLDRSDEGLIETQDPDGGFTIDTQGRFQDMMLARINAEGQLEVACFADIEAAMRFLTFTDSAPPPAEDPGIVR